MDKKFLESFRNYYGGLEVSDEYLEVIERYVLYGLPPGGMWTSIFANDILSASCRSHPSNDWDQLKRVMQWIVRTSPKQCWGSYEAVNEWCRLDAKTREEICSQAGIQTTMWDILSEKELG